MTMKILNGLDLAGQRINSVADPSSATDAATKSYVDNFVNGLAWKDAVDAASTANIANLSSPGASLDGQTFTSGHRYLLKSQTTASQNGIYTYNGSALVRSTDMASGVDARGYTVAVRGGSTNDDSTWNVTSDPAVVGTDSITWSQMSTGTTYIAGAGLTESPAGTFNVAVAAGSGITINADDIAVSSSVAGNGLTWTSGVLDIGSGNGITVAADSISLASSTAGAGLTYTAGVLSITQNSFLGYAESFDVGDGSSTSITLTLALIASRDASVQVFQKATPWQQVFPDVTRPSTTTVTLTFATAPTSAQYRCVVVGR